MSQYKGKPVTVPQPIDAVYGKVNNLEALAQNIERLPQEVKDRIGQVEITADSISVNAPMVGQLAFQVVERIEPTLMRMQAANSPLPFNIIVNFKPEGTDATTVSTVLDVDIPVMLRPMVGGKLQEAADKFGEMFTNLFKA